MTDGAHDDGVDVHLHYVRVPLKFSEPKGPYRYERIMPSLESQTTGHVHPRKIGQPKGESPNFRYEPPPKTRADHDWHHYGRHLTPDQVLHSVPVRRAAQDAADHGLDPSIGFAYEANHTWHRMGVDRRITTAQARQAYAGGGAVDLHPKPPLPFRSKPSDRARAPLSASTMRSGPGAHLGYKTGLKEFLPGAKPMSQRQIYGGG